MSYAVDLEDVEQEVITCRSGYFLPSPSCIPSSSAA